MRGNDKVLPQSYLLSVIVSVDNDLSNWTCVKCKGCVIYFGKEKLDEADKEGVMAFVRRQKPLGTVIVSLGKCPWIPPFAPAET